MKHIISFAGLYLFLMSMCTAQNEASQNDISRIVDDLVAMQDADLDYEEVYENLMQFLSHPVDLNDASEDELRKLYILSERQIQELIQHRKISGNLLSLYELQSIPEFDEITIQNLLPFVHVKSADEKLDRTFLKKITSSKNSYLIMRYDRTKEARKGDYSSVDNSFQGSADKIYLRLRSSQPGQYSFGFTAEKDAGERIKWNSAQKYYGADFLSAHLQLKNKGRLKNLIIGDYQCQFAQGLMLGSAFGLGKGGETISTIRKSNLGFMPYTSSLESGFYRGTAFTTQISRHVFFSGYYSHVLRDASVQNNDSIQTVSAFQSTGFHRTATELEDRKSAKEESYGAVLQWQSTRLDAGIIFQQINFSEPIERKQSAYNQFVFSGSSNTNLGAYTNASINNFTLFGEFAKSIHGGSAILSGALGSLHPKVDVALVYRNYARNYYGFYVNGFGESSQPQNEKGFYWGMKYKPSRKYTVSSYVDLFKFPWLSFRRYKPSFGHEWMLRFQYQPSKKVITFMQVREESKARNLATETNLYEIQNVVKRNYWMVANYQPTDHLKLKTRLQWSTVTIDRKTTNGLVMSQDIAFSFWKFDISARYAVFSADDFDNRQYSYEADAFMAFSLPSYSGVGIRNFILLEYKISKALSIWLRYSRSRYTDIEEIGSGLDAIEGNTRNDIKLQGLFRF
jgi:hypothetical protein